MSDIIKEKQRNVENTKRLDASSSNNKTYIEDMVTFDILFRIDHISACSIVVFNKEYQFQRQGIVTAYDPGHLSEHVLK